MIQTSPFFSYHHDSDFLIPRHTTHSLRTEELCAVCRSVKLQYEYIVGEFNYTYIIYFTCVHITNLDRAKVSQNITRYSWNYMVCLMTEVEMTTAILTV